MVIGWRIIDNLPNSSHTKLFHYTVISDLVQNCGWGELWEISKSSIIDGENFDELLQMCYV